MAQDSSQADFWENRYRDRTMPWDAGTVPDTLLQWLPGQAPGRVLIPGCGSAYEVAAFHEAGWDAQAIDFSELAVEQAKAKLGILADRVQLGDFFAVPAEPPYDLIYERAFLCALPRRMWADYARQCAALLKPGGSLSGFFFLKDTPHGPPFGSSEAELRALLGSSFELTEQRPVPASIPVFEGAEWWLSWRRR